MYEPHILPKLTVIYDPKSGIMSRDGEAESYIKIVINSFFEDGVNRVIKIGSELLIHYFRLALYRGEIGVDNIEFHFNGQILEHDKDGRLHPWPKGFCDYTENILSELLGWKAKDQ